MTLQFWPRGEHAIAYLRVNAPAMRNDRSRATGLLVASGVVEAACRAIVRLG